VRDSGQIYRMCRLRETGFATVPSKIDLVQEYSIVLCCMRGVWKEIACAATQIADRCVRGLRHGRQDSRREAGPRFANTRCACRQTLKQQDISPSAQLMTVWMVRQSHTNYDQIFFK